MNVNPINPKINKRQDDTEKEKGKQKQRRGGGEGGRELGTLESTTVLSGQATIQNTSHSAKFAILAALIFPNANKYGFFPASNTRRRNNLIKRR